MVATPSSTGIGEDQDALGAVHEGLGFSDIGARRPGLEFLPAIAANDQPARATGDFRHPVDTQAFAAAIKRSGTRRPGAELFDHTRARAECAAALYRVALLIAHWLGPVLAVFLV